MLKSGPFKGDIKRVLISKRRIKARVRKLARQIIRDYRGSAEPPVVVCIMKGAMYFFTDLTKAIGCKMQIEPDFMLISSYKGGVTSTDVVEILKDLRIDISGRHVLIIEDIVDTGRTMKALTDLLTMRNPKSIRICALLVKKVDRDVEISVHYQGFEIQDEFVVGYGLDYKEGYRHTDYIWILDPKVYCRS